MIAVPLALEEMRWVWLTVWWACAVMGRGRPWRSAKSSERQQTNPPILLQQSNSGGAQLLSPTAISPSLINLLIEEERCGGGWKKATSGSPSESAASSTTSSFFSFCCGKPEEKKIEVDGGAGLLYWMGWLWAGGPSSAAPFHSIQFFQIEFHFSSFAHQLWMPQAKNQPQSIVFLFNE